MKTFIIGNENAVLGFSLVGIDGRTVRTPEELNKALDDCLADRSIGLVLITSDVIPFAQERVEMLQITSDSPVIVEVPGEQGAARSGGSLQEFVQRAVGVRLGGD